MNRRQVAALKCWARVVLALYGAAFALGLLLGYWSAA